VTRRNKKKLFGDGIAELFVKDAQIGLKESNVRLVEVREDLNWIMLIQR